VLQTPILKSAWDAFRSGQLKAALQLSRQSIMQEQTNPSDSPMQYIRAQQAILELGRSQTRPALNLLLANLQETPDSQLYQGIYLAMLAESLKSQPHQSRVPQLIIGIGTGRCGSSSLSQLLKEQNANAFFSHEHPVRLAWGKSGQRLEWHLQRFKLLSKHFDFFGDVSHWWLPHCEQLLSLYPSCKIVALQREKTETIESFVNIKKTKHGTINHWSSSDANRIPNMWDECYPTYAIPHIEECLARYWEDYYTEVQDLKEKFASSVLIVRTEQLADPETQRQLLEFCGFNEIGINSDIHLNKLTASDSDGKW